MLINFPRGGYIVCVCCWLIACAPLDGTHYSTQSQQSLIQLNAWRQAQPSSESVTLLTDLVSSDELAALILQGLEHNPNLQQTALAINVARESVSSAQADRLPYADVSVSPSKNEGADVAYQSSLSVSWTLDWLGKLRDAANAKEAELLGTVAADQYARDLLAASIIDTWLQLVQQSQRIAIQQQRIAVLARNELTVVQRYRKGLGGLTELDAARSQTASAKSVLVNYQENEQVLSRAMGVLIGEPHYTVGKHREYPDVVAPLASFPAQDLGRRPDLLQAYLNIKSADLNSAVAYKSLLPAFSLKASLVDSDGSLSNALFTSPAWSLLGQLTMPLFHGGKLRSNVRKAEFTAEKAYWAYQESLLSAVKEVEDALGQEHALLAQQQHINDALMSAQRSADVYQDKYRQGLVTFLEMLTAQAQTFDLQEQRSQLIYKQLSNRITLGLALGLGVE